MVEVLYFASLREELGTDRERLAPDACPDTIGQLREQLASRGGAWHEAFTRQAGVLASINQEMADDAAALKDGDEVAFFPPVTGG